MKLPEWWQKIILFFSWKIRFSFARTKKKRSYFLTNLTLLQITLSIVIHISKTFSRQWGHSSKISFIQSCYLSPVISIPINSPSPVLRLRSFPLPMSTNRFAHFKETSNDRRQREWVSCFRLPRQRRGIVPPANTNCQRTNVSFVRQGERRKAKNKKERRKRRRWTK